MGKLYMALYHVTLATNIKGIYTSGLDPRLATGKEKKAWLVDETALFWAIAHCANRHDLLISDLVAIPFDVLPTRVMRTAWKGVYSTTQTLHATNHPRSCSTLVNDVEKRING